MKFIVVLLLAVNAFLLSVWTGGLSLWDRSEPDRLHRQVEAERISIQGIAAVATKAKAAASGDAPSGSGGTSPATPVPPPETKACLEFPPMDQDKAQSVESSMKQAGLSVEATQIEGVSSFMVHLPPSESAKEAQRKLAELKKLGVTDAFLLQEGPLKLGISLGLFRSEDGAKTLVQQLAAKGIRTARVAPGSGSRPAKTVLKATGSDALLTRVRQAADEVSLTLKTCGN